MAEENNEVQEQPAEAPAQQAPKQKGSKTPIIIIGAAILVVILGAVGFFFFKDLIMPAKGLTGKVLNSNCKLNDKDLCKFVSSFTGLDNMSAKSVTTINGKKTESVIEIQGTDKSHITSSSNGKEESNYIAIGSTTYMKDYTDNKWWKSTVDTSTTSKEKTDWKAEFEKSVNDNTDKTTYKKIGKEACGTLTCLKYQVIDPSITGSTEYIWFDTKNYALRKTLSETKEGVTTETTFSYDHINIVAPSPTKEMTSATNAYQSLLNSSSNSGAAASGLTPEQLKQLQDLQNTAPTDVPVDTSGQ